MKRSVNPLLRKQHETGQKTGKHLLMKYRASGKNSRVCSLCVCLHPSPLPSSGRNFISKGLTRKKGQVHCQRVKSKLGNGEKPAALTITGETGRRQMGKTPISASLRMSPDWGRWWASYKFNRKSWNGRAKGLKRTPHTSLPAGKLCMCAGGTWESPAERGCCCFRASHRAWNIGSAPCVSNPWVLIAICSIAVSCYNYFSEQYRV